MASKRIAKTSVEWAKLQKLLPQEQHHVYNNLLAKNFQFTSKVASLPENLPKIDFESYRKQLGNPSVIDKLEKNYLAFQAPYPKDSENALSKIDQAERQEEASLAEFMKEISQKIEGLRAEKFRLTNVPPLEEMTKELEVYYFPDRKVSFEHFVGEKDAYQQLYDSKKSGHGGHH